jgi:prepilin-type N-terminal cleavage/methylation domain-containing protein/prepilin-type processing-associated H-X9-DG protein
MFKKRDGVRGFSLIELLVVVTIIGVLVALMLPALSQARQAARSTLCGTNMKQIHTAINSYSTDHQMRLMYRAQYVASGVLVNGLWPGRYPNAGGYGLVPWQASLVGDNGYASRKLFIDPATGWPDSAYEENPGLAGDPVGTADGPFWWANYGCNDRSVMTVPTAPVGTNPPPVPKLRKLDSIKRPAEVMGVMDCGIYTINNTDVNLHRNATYVPGYKWTWTFTGLGTAMNEYRRIDANMGRHPGRSIQVMYMDGHVKPLVTQYELTIVSTAVFWTGG